jgi:hypothetical protein
LGFNGFWQRFDFWFAFYLGDEFELMGLIDLVSIFGDAGYSC